MPTTKASLKEKRSAEKRRQLRQMHKSRMKTFIKKAVNALRLANEGGSTGQAQQAVYQACSIIDKVMSKGVIKKNTSARYKSRLMKKLNALINQKAILQ